MDEFARAIIEERHRRAAAARRVRSLRGPWRARLAGRLVAVARRLDAASALPAPPMATTDQRPTSV